tara:strand:- start:14 stop:241 length:228 start_codon:yes stop_codon:yes gene_type:complete
MKCKDLGGPENCEVEFHAETFDEMAELSHKHGMEMKEDKDHQKAMGKMMELMKDPEKMKIWMEHKRQEFDELPED